MIYINTYAIILIPTILLLILLKKCWQVRSMPDMEKIVEILALGVALHLSYTLLKEAVSICSSESEKAAGPFIGGIVLAASSALGVWKILSSIRPQFPPKRPE